jgi:hypothetical protein
MAELRESGRLMQSVRRRERTRRRGAKLPTDADLNMMAQKYFKQQGSGEQQSWHLAFENSYTDGFKKTHHRQ